MAFPGDPIGLQIGHPDRPVTKLLVSLDPTLYALYHGIEHGCDAWLVHHPLIYSPAKSLVETTPTAKVAAAAIRADMALMGAHTNWDVAPGGINDVLADLFHIQGRFSWGSGVEEDLLKLVVFVTTGEVEELYEALATAGAGTIGRYTGCGFVGDGEGRFHAGPDTHPTVGQPGETSQIEEARIEMLVRSSQKDQVVRALLEAHPYEEPAFDWVRLDQKVAHRAGRAGTLPYPMPPDLFQAHVDEVLGCRSEAWFPSDREIRTVGFVGGAASGDWTHAVNAGIDAFVTGEVRQHDAVGAGESDLAIVAAGHYATENPGIVRLGELVAAELGIDLVRYEPEPGRAGRPS